MISMAMEFGCEEMLNLCDPHELFYNACRHNHMNIIQMLIEKGVEKSDLHFLDWNKGLYRACLGGHLNVIQWIIDKKCEHFLDLNYGLWGACKKGNLETA